MIQSQLIRVDVVADRFSVWVMMVQSRAGRRLLFATGTYYLLSNTILILTFE